MTDAVTVRPAEKSDIPELVELMNAQYERKKDERYFLWQYFDSFYPTILMCATTKGNVIGTFGLQKRELNNGLRAGQATDLLVAPECREQGVFKMLGLSAFSYWHDLDVLCVLPNLNGKNACEKAFEWQTVGKIDSVVLHKDSMDTASRELSAEDSGSEKGPVSFKYAAETRIWRYDQHPDYKYAYIKLITGEFAVVKIFTDPVTGVRYGDIVDFECDLRNPGLLSELFIKAIMYLHKEGVESITSWALPDTSLREVVGSLGFVDMPQERYFCVKALKHEYEYLYDLSNWHLVQADSEIY